ncbi:ribose-5-phosphate isomerase RpiA [Botrimarina sp.]|uniref:ribose-5-phosphate isomerase RpiA n=1 Tax=Botrimarina sp. TaxID=2795802 RepID=UPI0032EC715A
MTSLEAEKALAAQRAVAAEVADGMLVGLGTGSTATHAIRAIAQRVAGGLRIEAVGSSLASEALARSLGIDVLAGQTTPRLDLAIDGADEVDPRLVAIKGGGGALLREKVVAAAADRMLVVVDSTKTVDRLGAFPLPIEVLPFALAWVERALEEMGVDATLRVTDGEPATTDQGNYLLDAPLGPIDDPEAIAHRLKQIPGVIEHGLFLTEVDAVYVARGENVEVLSR